MAVDAERAPEARGEAGADAAPARGRRRRGARHALLALGWLCVALGAIGIVVPGMPTTIFLIIALWAFSRSSEQVRSWLYNHRRFGPPLQAWHAHGVIPARAKLAAVAVMAASVAVLAALSHDWIGPVALAAVMVPVAAFIVSRPSAVPAGRGGIGGC